MLGSHRFLMGTIITIGRKEWRFTSRPWEENYGELSIIVMEGYVLSDPKNKSDQYDKNEKLNDRALSVLYNALALSEFNRVKGLESK
jgi:hypothetical protein